MKFHDYRDLYGFYRRLVPKSERLSVRDYYAEMDRSVRRHRTERTVAAQNQASVELAWYSDGRPYYNVWPCVVPMFLKLDLSKVKTSAIDFPTMPLLFRFAEGHPVAPFEDQGRQYSLQSILFTKGPTLNNRTYEPMPGTYTLLVFMDFGETGQMPGGREFPVTSWFRIPFTDDCTVSEAIDRSLKHGLDEPGIKIADEMHHVAYRIIAACGLLSQGDDSIIVPDVINDDKLKYAQTKDLRYVEKAKRKGKFGWNVGEELEGRLKSPHERNPHFAVYWTGPGSRTPELRYRTGEGGGAILVNRKQLQAIPTGYLNQEEPKLDLT